MRTSTIIILCLLLGITGCKKEQSREMAAMEVPVIEIETEDVAFEREYVSQVYGYKDIPIRARIDGYLQKIHFEEGSMVKEGDLLYTIEAEPYEQAVTREASKLAEAKTALVKAKIDLDRITPLAKIDAVSQAELDGAEAAYEAAKANVDAAEANLRMNKINFDYSRITAPISGFIGKSKALEGEYVGRSPNPVILNTISKTDSIKVEFQISENEYLYLARRILDTANTQIQNNKGNSKIELILSDNTIFPYQGRFRFINRQIDPTTGSILLQAIFPNPNFLIKPGQFAKVRITTPPQPNTILIPQRAVRELQGKFSAYTISDSSTIKEQALDLGGTFRDYYVVSKGLKAGDQVLLEGLQKVRPGQKVQPNITEFQSRVTTNE